MFTQSMPALAQALSGALPEAALKQLMQALGNCQQPLTHRGAVNLQPPTTTGVGGLARPGVWNANNYTSIMPKAGDNVYVDIAGGDTNTVNNTNNYEGNQFSFPINQDFNYNNYYGGDTFNVAGNSTFNNSVHNTLRAGDTFVENLTVTNVYYTGDDPAPGGGVLPGGPLPRAPMPSPTLPGAIGTAQILKDVTVRGNVTVPTVDSAVVKDKSVDLTSTTTTKTVIVTGVVPVPAMSSATASVGIPTSGSFSASVTGIKLTPGVGTLTGTVTVPVVTGGYMDANCKLQITTSPVQYSVSLSGAPSVDVTSMGACSGSVTMSSATQSFPVSFACTGTTDVAVIASGSVTVTEISKATLKSDVIKITEGVVNKKLNLTVTPKKDFIVFIRPRF